MPSTQILSRLYVGDEIAAIAPEVHEFGCVLNITDEVPKSALLDEDPAVFFRRFLVYDVDGGEKEQEQMLQFFPQTCSLIQEHETLVQPVLVHCAEEKLRSCTVIAAFLVKSLGLTSSQAQAFILERHPQAFDFGTCVHFGPTLERLESVVRAAIFNGDNTRVNEN